MSWTLKNKIGQAVISTGQTDAQAKTAFIAEQAVSDYSQTYTEANVDEMIADRDKLVIGSKIFYRE